MFDHCNLGTENDMMDEDGYEHITVLSPIGQYVSTNNTLRNTEANEIGIGSLCLMSENFRAL